MKKHVNVAYADLGFTESHQIYLPVNSPEEGKRICNTLEKAGIIVDIMVRLGTQEVTMIGMKEKEMKKIANFIVSVLTKSKPLETIKAEVKDFLTTFRQNIT